MNIIREQRADVIQNRNSAQSHLRDILENFNKTSQNLTIQEPLQGDLDFSILSEFGLDNINEIILGPGEITNIRGLPFTLRTFICPSNLLVLLENIPISIINLEIPHNYLDNIDLSKLSNLERLIVTDNKMTKFENLPASLIELVCDSNELVHLDLIHLDNLRKLNISNNKITVIENLPESIFDFVMENTPSIEFKNSPGLDTVLKPKLDESSQSQNYNDALYEYFRLKKKYHDKMFNSRKKVFDKAPNKTAAKKNLATVKPLCIKCNRPVGSLFFNKNNRYFATCGDTQNPCKLDIQLFAGRIIPMSYILYIFKEDVEKTKDSIIRQKLDTLFNYISEDKSVELFKKELDAYNADSKIFKELLDTYNELNESPHKREQINKKNTEIFVISENIRTLLTEYEKTNNREILKTAMTMQIKELIPEVRNLRVLTNEVTEIHRNGIGEEFQLYQFPSAISKFDYIFGEPPRIIKFNK